MGAGGANISCGEVAGGHQKTGMQDMDVMQDTDVTQDTDVMQDVDVL